MGNAIKNNLVHSFSQLSEAKYLSLHESVNQSLSRAQLISDRAMIRRAMESYHKGKLTFQELQEYSETRYEDFAASIDRLLWSHRYLDGVLLVDYENETPLPFNSLSTPLLLTEGQNANFYEDHGKIILHVYSPVLSGEEVIGYDELAFDFSDIIAALSATTLQIELLTIDEVHSLQELGTFVSQSTLGKVYLTDDVYHWTALVTPNLFFVASQGKEQLLLPLSKLNVHLLIAATVTAIVYLLAIYLYVIRFARREIKALEIDQNIFKKAVTEAKTDYLTQAGNRRSAEENLAETFDQFQKGAQSPLIIIFDIDNFKSINDTYGHIVGDKVITAIVTSVLTLTSENHRFFRWGGDEFLLISSNTDASNAPRVAQTLIDTISTLSIKTELEEITPSISIGVSLFLAVDTSYMGAINRADQALYQAKEGSYPRFMSLFETS